MDEAIQDYSYPKETFDEYNKRAFLVYDKIKSEKIHRIYPHETICSVNRCYVINNGQIYFTDGDHPSQYIADIIVKKILSRIDFHSF